MCTPLSVWSVKCVCYTGDDQNPGSAVGLRSELWADSCLWSGTKGSEVTDSRQELRRLKGVVSPRSELQDHAIVL